VAAEESIVGDRLTQMAQLDLGIRQQPYNKLESVGFLTNWPRGTCNSQTRWT
jgi:hypothetical protein